MRNNMTTLATQMEDETLKLGAIDTLPLPEIGDKILIDVAPAIVGWKSWLHLGFVVWKWETRSGDTQAMVEIIGAIKEGCLELDPKPLDANGRYFTAPYSGRTGKPFKAEGPADEEAQF